MMVLSDIIAGNPTACCLMRDKEDQQNGIKECLLAVMRPFVGFFPRTRVHGRVVIPESSSPISLISPTLITGGQCTHRK